MAISDSQKIDSLYKKLIYGVTKTDTASNKSPSNEATPSPLLIRGDLIWGQATDIPQFPPVESTDIVTVYNDANASTILAIMDDTATPNRTWKTSIPRWISPEFGTQYAIKVYAAAASDSTPQTSGILLSPSGSGNEDAYQFDYQSGVLNFSDTNIPEDLSGKVIFIVGYQYSGSLGMGAFGVNGLGISVESTPLGHATAVNFGSGIAATVTDGLAEIAVSDTLQAVTDRGASTDNAVQFTNTTPSTSTTTGAVVVSGGVAVGGDIWTQGRVTSESLKIADTVFDSTEVLVNTMFATVIDSYAITDYRSAKYLIQINEGTAVDAKFQALEMLVIVDNIGTVYATEYGLVTSDGEMGEFMANVQSDNILRLYFTAYESSNKQIRVLRTAMTV